jgi:hypothetical protein
MNFWRNLTGMRCLAKFISFYCIWNSMKRTQEVCDLITSSKNVRFSKTLKNFCKFNFSKLVSYLVIMIHVIANVWRNVIWSNIFFRFRCNLTAYVILNFILRFYFISELNLLHTFPCKSLMKMNSFEIWII